MRSRLPAPALAACVAGFSCGGEPAGPRISETPARLEFVREWLRPSLGPETDFVTYPLNVAYDRETDHLFVQDRDTKTIIEVDESGALVRVFGREGLGPGEIAHPSEVAVDRDHVIAVDNGNLKILIFRRDASLESEFRIPQFVRDLEILEDGTLMIVPGKEHAVEVLDLEGETLRGFGDRSLMRVGYCTGCALARLADGRVAVLDAHRLDMLLFRPETGETTRIDLMEIPLMAAWHEEVAAELRRIQRMGGGRQWVQGDMHRVDGSSVLVTAGPPDLVERGMELWKLDLSSGDIRRYDYGEPFVGYWIAVDWPRLFTAHLDTGAILEYRIPDDE